MWVNCACDLVHNCVCTKHIVYTSVFVNDSCTFACSFIPLSLLAFRQLSEYSWSLYPASVMELGVYWNRVVRLSHFCLEDIFRTTILYTCKKCGFLSSRSRSQCRLKSSRITVPYLKFLTFCNQNGIVMHYEPEHFVAVFDCCARGQDHSEG